MSKMDSSSLKGMNRVIKDPITKKNIMDITFSRENGLLVVRCKSETFESFFKNQAQGNIMKDEDYDFTWNQPYIGFKKNIESYTFNRTNSEMYYAYRGFGIVEASTLMNTNDYDVPYMGFITAVGLGKGLKFVVCNEPLEASLFNTYCEKCMEWVLKFYKRYLTPKKSKGKITMKMEQIQ